MVPAILIKSANRWNCGVSSLKFLCHLRDQTHSCSCKFHAPVFVFNLLLQKMLKWYTRRCCVPFWRLELLFKDTRCEPLSRSEKYALWTIKSFRKMHVVNHQVVQKDTRCEPSSRSERYALWTIKSFRKQSPLINQKRRPVCWYAKMRTGKHIQLRCLGVGCFNFNKSVLCRRYFLWSSL